MKENNFSRLDFLKSTSAVAAAGAMFREKKRLKQELGNEEGHGKMELE
ncbi:MAG: hypothetical protein JW837_04965 [Sedimentisphaerales bacterium]|nr:hypothetical protein [Sedimentisphaerales bacterium]